MFDVTESSSRNIGFVTDVEPAKLRCDVVITGPSRRHGSNTCSNVFNSNKARTGRSKSASAAANIRPQIRKFLNGSMQ